jgi:hypothetical protein
MTLQEVITKAIEGGYKGNKEFLLKLPEYAKSQIWLDPLFWQSLGKAMGWNVSEPQVTRSKVGIEGGEFKGYVHNGYVVHWIDFVEHLAEGKDAESFFETL